jgi:large subunit ribosomal protein L22
MAAAATTDEKVLVRARATYVRTSARKARVVLEHVRGRSYAKAHAYLTFANQAVARDILAVLESAAANAESNLDLDSDELVVEACFADEGPTAKRWQPRARGRANRIRKRTCHVTIVLRYEPPAEGEAPRSRRKSAAQATIEASTKPRRSRAKAAAPAGAVEDAPAAETEAAAETAEVETEAPEAAAEPAQVEEPVAEATDGEPEAAADAEAEEPKAESDDDTTSDEEA